MRNGVCGFVFGRFLWTVIVLTLIAGPVQAEESRGPSSKTDLRAEQSLLFEEMRANPQNLDVMFSYAAISARLEDYEAAISTLERMLIFNENLPRVRLELGALYFRIGAYAVAERYFNGVKDAPDVPAEVAERIDAYLAQVEVRQRRHHFSGRAEIAFIADTNANLGPSDRGVLLFGLPAELDRASVENDDIGGRLSLEASHIFDLQRTGYDAWRTDASYLGRRYDDEDQGDLDAFFIRTGPELSLDTLTFGPKFRPFVDAEFVRADDRSLYRGAGAGLQYRQTPGDEWAIFGELRGGYRDYITRDDEDGIVGLARFGVAWLPGRDTTLTASLTARHDEATEDINSNSEGILRVSASFAYDPGFSFADDKWILSAYGSAGMRHFDEPDPVVSTSQNRRDQEYRLGASHVFNFSDGFYGSIGATALWRKSNLPNFDLENIGVSAALGYKF